MGKVRIALGDNSKKHRMGIGDRSKVIETQIVDKGQFGKPKKGSFLRTENRHQNDRSLRRDLTRNKANEAEKIEYDLRKQKGAKFESINKK